MGTGGERDRERGGRRMGHAFDQSVGFEGVDDGHHRVAMDSERRRELALGLAVFCRERHQHGVGPGLHPDTADPVLKLDRDVRTELGQQKGDAFVERRNAGRRSFMPLTIALLMIVMYRDDHQQ